MGILQKLGLGTLLILLLQSCTTGTAEQKTPVPEGDLFSKEVLFQYGLYYLPGYSANPLEQLEQLVKDSFPHIIVTDTLPDLLEKQYLYARVVTSEEYAPQDSIALNYFGRGLSPEQVRDLQKSETALVLDFAHPTELLWQGIGDANRLLCLLGKENEALLWDEETRETFTPEWWEKERIQTWEETFPKMSDHVTVHAYKNDELVRAVSLGMRKFGLPDVVVNDFPWSSYETVASLIDLFMQVAVEGGEVKKGSTMTLDLNRIKNSSVREAQLGSLQANAASKAAVKLKPAKTELGDPDNRLWEICFDTYKGKDLHAKQKAMLAELYGFNDTIIYVSNDDPELEAASEKAKAELPRLKELFNKGLEPGEYIILKAPFRKPDGGNEWMWVEVSRWEGGTITGLLQNEPFHIPTLHKGQEVQVKQEDIFDFLRYFPDGTYEGDFTGPIVQKKSMGSQAK